MLLHCMSIILRPNCDVTVALLSYFDGLQHKGAMSTKPVFEKIAKIQRSYVPYAFVAF